jgi:ubiquinone biosynthesis protein UbiJ
MNEEAKNEVLKMLTRHMNSVKSRMQSQIEYVKKQERLYFASINDSGWGSLSHSARELAKNYDEIAVLEKEIKAIEERIADIKENY